MVGVTSVECGANVGTGCVGTCFEEASSGGRLSRLVDCGLAVCWSGESAAVPALRNRREHREGNSGGKQGYGEKLCSSKTGKQEGKSGGLGQNMKAMRRLFPTRRQEGIEWRTPEKVVWCKLKLL